VTEPPRKAQAHASTAAARGAAWSPNGQSKRDQIVAAAVVVLAREGLSETTTRKIAAEAGANQAMIGYYFGGKDDLLFAALQEMMRLTATVVRAAMSDETAPERALAGAMRAFWAYVETNYALQIMQYELTLYALRRPESAWLAREQYAGYISLVADLARAAWEAASRVCALPFDELARFIVGGLDGLILQYVSDRDQQRARRDLERLISAAVALASGAAGSEGPADAQ
jgi:AcrR family transcriptional regulator